MLFIQVKYIVETDETRFYIKGLKNPLPMKEFKSKGKQCVFSWLNNLGWQRVGTYNI